MGHIDIISINLCFYGRLAKDYEHGPEILGNVSCTSRSPQ
jgi:hypothetical protein